MSKSAYELPDGVHFCLCRYVWPDAIPAPRLPQLRSKGGRWWCVCPACNFCVGWDVGFDHPRAAISCWQTCCKPRDQFIMELWLQEYSAQGQKTEKREAA